MLDVGGRRCHSPKRAKGVLTMNQGWQLFGPASCERKPPDCRVQVDLSIRCTCIFFPRSWHVRSLMLESKV